MDKNESYLCRLSYKLLIHESNGQAFENLFIKVMRKTYQDFQPVKAYGNIGDMKNDGFDKTRGVYYQIYGPEDISKEKTLKNAVKKLSTDFSGLYQQWQSLCPIKEFNYVINDKYMGINALVHQELVKLDNEYPDIQFNIMSAANLEDILFKLSINEIIDIVGFFPHVDLDMIDYSVLNEVIDHVMNSEVSFSIHSKLVIPDFYEKIEFNGLDPQINSILVNASYSVGHLEEYFSKNSQYMKNELKIKLSDFYAESKEKINLSEESYADKRFQYVLGKCCPKYTKSIIDAGLVLVAFYFESCDIFEEPQKAKQKVELS